jgi:uncharacterized membrane protein YeaQ/YmgE (transglycosylase-associated protein family)
VDVSPEFVLVFWLLPVVVAQLIANHRAHEGGWLWGCLLGWIGVVVVTLKS